MKFQGYFIYLNNEINYGHLIDPDNYNTSLILPELYELFTNSKVNFILKKESNLNLSGFFKGLESSIYSS